jgi:hypothetical protein
MRTTFLLMRLDTRYRWLCATGTDDEVLSWEAARLNVVWEAWLRQGLPGKGLFLAWAWVVHYGLSPVRWVCGRRR